VAFTILSLCSGVGGLELGLRAALPESRVVGYVEREAFAASVLLARMEEKAMEPAPIWCGDLTDCDFTPFIGQVDCITAGFPCQPWSVAGKRKGTDDERWLWDHIVDTIRTVRPRYVFLENVPGLVTGGGLPAVLRSLAEIGFDAEWMCLRASAVGASHRRERVFILAHAQRYAGGASLAGREEEGRVATRGSGCSVADAQGREFQQDNEVDTVSGSGNARQDVGRSSRELADAGNIDDERRRDPGVVARTQEEARGEAGECHQGRASVDDSGITVADASSQRLQGLELQAPLRDGEGPGSHGSTAELCCPLFAPGPGSDQWGAILKFDPSLEPAICRMADGMAHRLDRLRACGNGVVPLQAAVAFVELSRRMNAS